MGPVTVSTVCTEENNHKRKMTFFTLATNPVRMLPSGDLDCWFMLRVDTHFPFSNTSFRPFVKKCFLNVASIIRVFWNTKEDALRHCHVEILLNILYSKRHVSNYHVIIVLIAVKSTVLSENNTSPRFQVI